MPVGRLSRSAGGCAMSQARLEQARDRITSQVFGTWWRHRTAGTGQAVPHLDAALAAVAQAEGRLLQGVIRLGENHVALAPSRGTGPLKLSQCLASLLATLDWQAS